MDAFILRSGLTLTFPLFICSILRSVDMQLRVRSRTVYCLVGTSVCAVVLWIPAKMGHFIILANNEDSLYFIHAFPLKSKAIHLPYNRELKWPN